MTGALVSGLGIGEPAGLRAVHLTGPAGIGKTSLWQWALDAATAAGWRVLATRCSSAETRLPWVALTDLLGPVTDTDLDDLPGPQRAALAVVTLRGGSTDDAPLERTVGTALTTLWRNLAARCPLLIAVDDVAAADPLSARAMQFAHRRLEAATGLAMLTSARTDDVLTGGLPPDGAARIDVGPLTVGALFQLIRERLGSTLSRPTVLRMHEATGGNPLYSLEIARAMTDGRVIDRPGRPLALPEGAEPLLEQRIRDLAAPLRELVAAATATHRLPVEDVAPALLGSARAEGLVDIVAGAVRPAHPLLGAAAYAALSDGQRARLHETLAAKSADPVERARHLATCGTLPGAELARQLDAAAHAAAARGAVDVAADLARLALENTSDGDDERADRAARVADLLLRCGDSAAAADAQRDAVSSSPAGARRARQLVKLAEIVVEADWQAAIPLLQAAIDEATGDPTAEAEARLTLAAVLYDDLSAGLDHAQRALDLLLATPSAEPALLGAALQQYASANFRSGGGLDHDAFSRAITLQRSQPTALPRLSDRADAAYAALLKYADDLDASQALFDELLAEASASGDVSSLAYVRLHLPQLALWRGEFELARAHSEALLELMRSADLSSQLRQAVFIVALVDAHTGRTEAAAAALDAELATISDLDAWDAQRVHGARGFLAWSIGDVAVAEAHLDRWAALIRQVALDEPGYSRYHRDYAEVLVHVGRLDDAQDFLDITAVQAERTGRVSAQAAVASGRALLAAARGDHTGATALSGSALELLAPTALRFDRARTLLAAGMVHRRAKAKLVARDALTSARGEFLEMGATAWAQRAEVELARVNIRPAAPDTLTETERRVAELAAAGMTNRQVADALFLAPKTVEANLSRVYRKLGVGSRAELGARFGRDQGA